MPPKAKSTPTLVSTLLGHAKHAHSIYKDVSNLGKRKKKPTVPDCARCDKKADVYCADCKQSQCRFCASLLHHPTTKAEKHSIEEIDTHIHGVRILTPILLDALLFCLLLFLLRAGRVTYDARYYDGHSHCLGVGYLRSAIARFDVNVFYYFKTKMATMCDVEDSFWRLLLDTYWRAILTGTDSLLLLIGTFPTAVIFEEFIRALLAPAIGVVYAAIAVVARQFERRIKLPDEGADEEVQHPLRRWEAFIRTWNLSQFITPAGKPPPLTHRRRRPATDYKEFAMYTYHRQLRSFEYYQAHAQAMMGTLLRVLVAACILVRILCLIFPVHEGLRIFMRLIGLRGKHLRQTRWFEDVTGIRLQSDNTGAYYSDWLVALGIRKAFSSIPSLHKDLEGVRHGLFMGLFTALKPIVTTWIFWVAVLAFVGWWRFGELIKRQQEEFKKEWKKTDGIRDTLWGKGVDRKNLVDWERVRFDHDSDSQPSQGIIKDFFAGAFWDKTYGLGTCPAVSSAPPATS